MTGKGKQNATKRGEAIKRYCLSCMNGQEREVKKCTVTDCPLFIYRKGGVEKVIKMSPIKKLNRREAVLFDSS
jgi:hypothetical protein